MKKNVALLVAEIIIAIQIKRKKSISNLSEEQKFKNSVGW